MAISQNSLGVFLKNHAKYLEAEVAYRASLAEFNRLKADFPTVPVYRRDLAGTHSNLGHVLTILGRHTEAETAYAEALDVQEELRADFPAVPDYAVDLAGSHCNFGILLRDRGEPAEAAASACNRSDDSWPASQGGAVSLNRLVAAVSADDPSVRPTNVADRPACGV
jgi:tetratricopeptide (TPR) repeat protein